MVGIKTEAFVISPDIARALYSEKPTLENLSLVLGTYGDVGFAPQQHQPYTPANEQSIGLPLLSYSNIHEILAASKHSSETIQRRGDAIVAGYLAPIIAERTQQILDMVGSAWRDHPVERHQQLAVAHLLMGNSEKALSHLDTAESLVLSRSNSMEPDNLAQLIVIQHRRVSLAIHNTAANQAAMRKAETWLDYLFVRNSKMAAPLRLLHFGLMTSQPEACGITSREEVVGLYHAMEREARLALKPGTPPPLKSFYYSFLLNARLFLTEDSLRYMREALQNSPENKGVIRRGRASLFEAFSKLGTEAAQQVPDAELHDYLSNGHRVFAQFDFPSDEVDPEWAASDLLTSCAGGAVLFGAATKILGGPVGMGMSWGCAAGETNRSVTRYYTHSASVPFEDIATQIGTTLFLGGVGATSHVISRTLGEWGIRHGVKVLSKVGIETAPWLGNAALFVNHHVLAYAANAAAITTASNTPDTFLDTFARIRIFGFFVSKASSVQWQRGWDRVVAYGVAGLGGIIASEGVIELMHPNTSTLQERIASSTSQMLLLQSIFAVAGVYKMALSTIPKTTPKPLASTVGMKEPKYYKVIDREGNPTWFTFNEWVAKYDSHWDVSRRQGVNRLLSEPDSIEKLPPPRMVPFDRR